MIVNGQDGTRIELSQNDDFVATTRRIQDEVEVKDSELIFCGYGIISKEQDWNDYEGVDLAGKTVVVLVNDPGFRSNDPNLFEGRTMTYFGRWTYKYEEGARQKAAGGSIEMKRF